MQKIDHIIQPNRSRLYKILIKAIQNAGQSFPSGVLKCKVATSPGFAGNVDIVVGKNRNSLNFAAKNWKHRATSTFPQRIRATATALRDTGIFGCFRVVAQNGSVEVAKI